MLTYLLKLALAEALRAAGAQCVFISRAHPGHLLELIRLRGFAVTALSAELLQPPANKQVVCERSQESVHSSWLGCDWKIGAEAMIKAAAEWSPDGIDWLVIHSQCFPCVNCFFSKFRHRQNGAHQVLPICLTQIGS